MKMVVVAQALGRAREQEARQAGHLLAVAGVLRGQELVRRVAGPQRERVRPRQLEECRQSRSQMPWPVVR